MRLSVVVRAKNEEAGIGRTLELLSAQTVGEQIQTIVVDSGSTDGTVQIAREAGAEIVEIPSSAFNYGYALNVGCRRAVAPLVIALSAHAFPPDENWAGRMLEVMEDETVACACGYDVAADGGTLHGRAVQDEAHLRRYPMWGYSNGSGIFRRALWQQRPFREDMPGTEDKEWSAYWIVQQRVCVIDPALSVIHSHHDEGPRLTFDRSRREWEGHAMYLPMPAYPVSRLISDWWGATPPERRIGWRRTVGLLGKWTGVRRGRARWTPSVPGL